MLVKISMMQVILYINAVILKMGFALILRKLMHLFLCEIQYIMRMDLLVIFRRDILLPTWVFKPSLAGTSSVWYRATINYHRLQTQTK